MSSIKVLIIYLSPSSSALILYHMESTNKKNKEVFIASKSYVADLSYDSILVMPRVPSAKVLRMRTRNKTTLVF
jgi:hypothetical protein